MSRVKVGFFSMTGASAAGDDRPYLRWHALDHMPQQYQIPGILHGQRWEATPRCLEVRAAASAELDPIRYVVQYLMTEPVQETLDEFAQLGRTLAQVGRYPEKVRSHLLGAFDVVATYAAPRVLVSAEVVPFRPNRGIYVIVRAYGDADDESLLGCPGVAGVWSFETATDVTHNPMWSERRYRITVCYLDADPVEVAADLGRVAGKTRPLFAGPFESMVRWDWDRFGVG